MMNKQRVIDSFDGQYAFLSNFWKCDIEYQNLCYPSVEHAYQAQKTLDKDIQKVISLLDSPVKAKRYGRTIELRSDWDKIKYNVMLKIVTRKFKNNTDLFQKLLDTAPSKLIEGNTWGDVYWGICNGKGENNLCKILMAIRDSPMN